MVPARSEVIERMIREKPLLHYLTPETATAHGKALERTGVVLPPPGPYSIGVAPKVLRFFGTVVKPTDRTMETGCGLTTVALGALGQHHTCISPDEIGRDRVISYMLQNGLAPEKVNFLLQSSDQALPSLSGTVTIDFAFIDGCHGYPFPALDWHYMDLILNEGGLIGFDNVELRSVAHHCEFMDANKTYELVEDIRVGQWGNAKFYRKLKNQQREWVFQSFNVGREVFPKPRGALGLLKRMVKPLVTSLRTKQ
jgi:hypothetical protein